MFRKKLFQKSIIILAVTFVFFLITDNTSANTTTPDGITLDPPTVKVSIPGMTGLEKVDCETGVCYIPWVGEYIASLTNYAISFISILAVVIIMLGGLVWIAAGGNPNRVAEAKKMITGGVTGVIIIMSSYLILYTINPNLTILKSIRMPFIEKIDIETMVINEHDPQFDPANGKPITDTTFDETFKNFAACINVDWRVLKGIAYKESTLRPTVVNKYGFTGLFQTKDKYCADSVRHIGLSSSFCRAGVKDPAVNTAVATGMMKVNLGNINKYCSSISDSAKIFLIYYAHSSGGGALTNNIKKYGCNIGSWPDSKPPFNGAPRKYVVQTVETILAQGVTSLNNSSDNGTCPKG